MSVPGRIGSHQSAFAAAVEKRGSTTISLAPRDSPSANAVTCEVNTFSPMCVPIRTMSFDFLQVNRLGRAQALAEGERVADFARTAALRERRLGAVRRAEGFHQRAEESRGNAVREERDTLRPVLLLQLRQPLRETDRAPGPS